MGNLLRGNRHLQEIYLSVNRLGDTSLSRIASGLHENRSLKILGLASNGIGPVGAEALCKVLENHSRLHSLDLGFSRSTKVLGAVANHMDDAGALHIAQLIRSNQSLRYLDIRKNGIGSHGLKSIAESLATNDFLQELSHDKTRVSWLKMEINKHLHRNRAGKPMPQASADVQAIKSVYR